MGDYETALARVCRERMTEEWVRAHDAADIVERLHWLEDDADEKDGRISELEAENERLTLLVEQAFKEGFDAGRTYPSPLLASLHKPDISWKVSSAYKALAGEE